jgi:uncharacterized Tic20 family protein
MFEQPKPKRGVPSGNDDDVIDLDVLIRDYGSDDAPSKPKRKNDQLNRDAVIQPPRVSLLASYNLAHVPDYVEENPEHRKQAAIAHLMVVIGILISFASLGALLPLALIISRQIYAQNRARSPFLAHHSLQAVVVLTGATLGWFVRTAATVIAVFSAFILPIFIVVIVALMISLSWLLYTAVTIGTFFYGFVGISQALKGKTFRYPLSLFSFGVETHDFFPSVLRPDKMVR